MVFLPFHSHSSIDLTNKRFLSFINDVSTSVKFHYKSSLIFNRKISIRDWFWQHFRVLLLFMGKNKMSKIKVKSFWKNWFEITLFKNKYCDDMCDLVCECKFVCVCVCCVCVCGRERGRDRKNNVCVSNGAPLSILSQGQYNVCTFFVCVLHGTLKDVRKYDRLKYD